MSHFSGHFETFLTPALGQFRGQKSRGPLKMSREMAHKVILPPKKNYIKKFLKQRDIGIFIYQSAVVYCCCVLLSVVGCSCVLLFVVASYELYVRRY